MTSFTKNLLIAAAALLATAGMAGAQTIKAEVPFGFRVAGKAMPAGAYTVSASRLGGGSLVFRLSNDDSKHSVMTAPYARSSQKAGATDAWLAFQCSGEQCALAQITPGSGETYQVPQPKMSGEGTRLAVIHAVLLSAE